jgi:hypothetical protein
MYHHLNMGWGDSGYNLWYSLSSDIDASGYQFTAIWSCIYNVYTNGSGEIISGHVTDMNGVPLTNVTVTASCSSGGTYTAITDTNGLYALTHLPMNSQFSLSVPKLGYVTGVGTFSTGSSGAFASGSLWGADFALPNGPSLLLSHGFPVSASSYFYETSCEVFPPSNLTDGLYNDSGSCGDYSFWLPNGGVPAWAIIDLLEVHDVHSFTIQNTHNRGYNDHGTTQFSMSVSTDGTNYTTVLAHQPLQWTDSSESPIPFQIFSLPSSVPARFIRIDIEAWAGAGGGLNELDVYGDSRLAPTLTWTNPADIVYGTALNIGQLNAAASVAGTYSYNPPPFTILNVGSNQTLSVTFTPADTNSYSPATTSVTINVQQPVSVSGSVLQGLDIGNPSLPGSTTFVSPADYNVVGGGVDIFFNSDQFQFSYQIVTNDFDASVQVTNLTLAGLYAKAGLMARVDLTPGSPNVYGLVTPTYGANYYQFHYRTAENGTTIEQLFNGPPVPIPNAWLRLTRAGNTFTYYSGTNGINWTQIGQVAITLPSTLLFGLATSAATNNEVTGNPLTTMASYVNYSVTGATALAPPVFTAVTLTNGSIVLSSAAVAGQSYQLQYTTNLSSSSWNNLGASTNAIGPIIIPDVIGSNAQRFYRVMLLP